MKLKMSAKAMEAPKLTKEEIQMASQLKEFGEYLAEKIKVSDFPFFTDMYKKLVLGITLTPNMEDALRRCITKDAEREANKLKPVEQKPVEQKDLPKITCKIRQWIMKQNNLDSRIISGVIKRETAKAYLIEGHADMIEGSWCMRCGRELTEPASMVIGYGAICCEKVGIPYPDAILTASKAKRKAIRKELLKVLHAQKFELWIPKSQVETVY